MDSPDVELEVSGQVVKEWATQILIDNGDGSATWYQKALLRGEVRNPHTGVYTAVGPRRAAIRNVKLK